MPDPLWGYPICKCRVIDASGNYVDFTNVDLPNIVVDIDEIVAEVNEIEHHFHNIERWLGSLAGTNKVAGDVLTAFTVASALNAYGTAVKVLDSADTPVQAGKVKFDLHKILITAATSNTIYKIRLAWGATNAAAITAGNYTELMYMNDAGATRRVPILVMMPRLDVGTIVWASIWNATNLASMTMYIGLHEYAA